MVAFDSEFGFSLRERKPATLDDAQTDALELEAKFSSTGKSKGRSEQDMRRRGKEEVSTSSQGRDLAKDRIEEMNKMIKNLSRKLVKLEMEAKNSSSKNFQNAPNRGFNPQYRKPPLQIMQRGQKEQQDQVPHPLYLEGQVEGSTEDNAYEQEEAYLAFSKNYDVECTVHGSEEVEVAHTEVKANEDTEDIDIDDYCKQFVDFMQT